MVIILLVVVQTPGEGIVVPPIILSNVELTVGPSYIRTVSYPDSVSKEITMA